MDFKNAQKTMLVAREQMQRMMEKLNGIALGTGVPKLADKPATRKEKKKTKKGAVHKVNPVFRARKIATVTPAKFRRMNLGMIRDIPNWKKPHAAPRWRNRWTSPLS